MKRLIGKMKLVYNKESSEESFLTKGLDHNNSSILLNTANVDFKIRFGVKAEPLSLYNGQSFRVVLN